MKSVAFFNNKGGVGKTTLACNLVSYISKHENLRVLLIDCDPQCNATQAFLDERVCEEIYDEAFEGIRQKTVYDLLRPLEDGEPGIASKKAIYPRTKTKYETDLLPGHPSLSLIEDRLSVSWSEMKAGDVRGFRITNWAFHMLEMYKDDYDLIVFDVGPSLGALNRTVILASDYLVTPFGCDIFSILGIKNISGWIDDWQGEYTRALTSLKQTKGLGRIEEFNCLVSIENRFRLAGYSVQQYQKRKFKAGQRPVKAYEEIMKEIPAAVEDYLKFISITHDQEKIRLGDIPYVYSLVPLSQSSKTPIHSLTSADGLNGAQYKQVDGYRENLKKVSDKFLENIGLK